MSLRNNLIIFLVASLMICFLPSLKAQLDFNNINVGEIKDKLPGELTKQNFTLDQAKDMLKEKCIQTAGEVNGTKAAEEIESGFLQFSECATNLVNFTALQAEIAEASPKGELDDVFHKYCEKKADALHCAEQLNEKFVPCLEKEERENQDVFMRIMRSLLDFVCEKGGDRIALFIAEKGPECIESKGDDIQVCLNTTLSGYIPKDGFDNVNSIPKLVMDEKHCQDIDKLEKCIVNKLETCEEITPANIVESMFRFIRNETICRNSKKSPAALHSSDSSKGASQQLAANVSFFVIVLSIFGLVSKYL